jgi:hypothetical protein
MPYAKLFNFFKSSKFSASLQTNAELDCIKFKTMNVGLDPLSYHFV